MKAIKTMFGVIVCSLMLAFFTVPAAAAETSPVSVETTAAGQGSVEFTVKLNDANQLTSGRYVTYYDADLFEVADTKTGGVFEVEDCNPAYTADGKTGVSYAGVSSDAITSGGTLMTVTFRLKSDIQKATGTFETAPIELYQGDNAVAISSDSVKTSVTVEQTVVKLSKTKAVVVKGKTIQLKATVTPKQSIKWSSENKKIATVNKNGKVTGKKGGTTKIIATAKDGTKATCKVTVATVKLNASSMPLQVGTSTKALKVASKTVKKDKVKAWKSSDSSIASVSKSGKVTAKKTGKATLTVTMKSGAKATCKVTVQNEKVTTKKLTLSKKKATLTVKQSVKLGVKRNPISAKEKITWSSSNKKVATVSESGKVTAKKAGKATITAKTSNGKKATCKITVKKATKK